MGGLSLISTGWCCLGLASLSTTYCRSCLAHCIKPKDTEEEYCHFERYLHLLSILLFVHNSFHCNMWECKNTKLHVVCQLQACWDSAIVSCGVWWYCVLQYSLAWSYLSLIRNYCIVSHTHMHAPVPANTGERHRPCQPRCDTEHDNVCNLLGVVCLPPALPFEVLPPVPLQPYCNSTTQPVREPVLCPITF